MQTEHVNTSHEAKPARSAVLPSIQSVALQRLIDEVRRPQAEIQCDVTLYNRTYHRHNR